jgi:transketolase
VIDILDEIELWDKADQMRKWVLEVCINAKTGHLTSSLSCIDILVALYYGGIIKHDPRNPKWDQRDRFILSKGQASPALYCILADCGYYNKSELTKFAQKDGMFGVHLQNSVPGVEITAGSLGHGFNIATGMALVAKKDRTHNMVFALLGDGECYEGSIWEAAMFASHNNLNNLVAIIDRNYLCATDFTEECLSIEPLLDKWKSFGWDVSRINGNDMYEVMRALKYVRSRRSSKPQMIIADTVKGAGIKCTYDQPLWHARTPLKHDDICKCRKELKDE